MKPSTPLMVALGLLAGAGAARAAVFCVDTPAELQAALDIAATNNQDDVIRLEPGVYAAPGGASFDYEGAAENHDLVISGGWRTVGIPPTQIPCLLRLAIDPRQTQLTGGTTTGNLRAWLGAGDLTIEGLTFASGHSLGTQAAGGAYLWADGDIRVQYSLFVGNEGFWAGGLQAYTTGTLHVVDNLFVGNQSQISNGAAVLQAATGWVTHNGFVASTSPQEAVQVLPNASNLFVLTSNLFWGNAVGDLEFELAPYPLPLLIRNLVETLPQIAGDIHPASVGNLSADPQFAPPGECDRVLGWELGAGSPALDAGSLNPPGGMPAQDLIGHARLVGAGPDIGPLERRVAFCDGVESGNTAAWSAVQP